MPKLPKFEEWKAPWETAGTEFDAEKAKKRIYDLLSDKEVAAEKHTTDLATLTTKNTELQKTVDEAASANLTAAEKLEKEKNDLQAKLTDAGEKDLEVARLTIALDKGLTASQAKRLVGKTVAELQADATQLTDDLGLTKDGKPVEQEHVDETNTSRRTPANRVRNPLNPEGDGNGLSADQLLKALPRD